MRSAPERKRFAHRWLGHPRCSPAPPARSPSSLRSSEMHRVRTADRSFVGVILPAGLRRILAGAWTEHPHCEALRDRPIAAYSRGSRSPMRPQSSRCPTQSCIEMSTSRRRSRSMAPASAANRAHVDQTVRRCTSPRGCMSRDRRHQTRDSASQRSRARAHAGRVEDRILQRLPEVLAVDARVADGLSRLQTAHVIARSNRQRWWNAQRAKGVT